ncbi:HD domain-containing protein [Planococcus sp. MERTA32b]|nr:HD domain-containing protein [Planococcus sp. MER TA 32b]
MNQLIEKATCFAAVKHDGQYRKGTRIPYITHPYGVAMILMEANQPEVTIAAGLLHDTLENTDTTEEEIFRIFGEEILMLVKAASEKDKAQPWEKRKQQTIANLPYHSANELYLILADKLHNLRSIQVDARKFGDSIWTRFNRGKREQCWYYMSISRAVRDKKREVSLIRKLEEETNELFIGKKRLTNHDIRLLFESIRSESPTVKDDLRESRLLQFSDDMRKAAGEQAESETENSIQNRWEIAGVDLSAHIGHDPFIYSYLHEMKFRLGWEDETFLEYFNLYYKGN